MKPVLYPFVNFWFFVFVSCCLSCGYSNEMNEHQTIDELSQNYILSSTTEVFQSLPSPVKTAELIKNTGVRFDERILNPVRNVPYYETSYSMALNMGVYCADLSYTTFYDQKQITMEYLGAVKTIAEGLGLKEMLKDKDIIILEENLYNKDSIKQLVHEIFFSSGEYLNDNNRPEIALLVEVGGWIEGLYVALQLAKQSGHINKELVDRVAEQRNSIILVIASLENFANIEPINDVLMDMRNLKLIYDKMVLQEGDKFDSNAVVILSKNSKAFVTPEIFMSLYHQINNIRNSYTQ